MGQHPAHVLGAVAEFERAFVREFGLAGDFFLKT